LPWDYLLPEPLLSVIFPAHNEEQRLAHCLDKTMDFLNRQPYSSEVVIVENGSDDRTLVIAREYAERFPTIQVLHELAAGKGRAIKKGMLASRGDFRFACDVDLSMPIQEVNRFIPPALTEDIVIASREAPGAVRYNEPAYRHFIGRVFNLLVRIIALHKIQDSQCGFKCFSRRAVEELFPLQSIMGWTFDVEILFIAQKMGYKIVEVGIPWYHDPNTKVRVMKDSFRMLSDLFLIRWNHLRGRYAG
jgi:glycosyltransferase involved in cell wall biosynthesis